MTQNVRQKNELSPRQERGIAALLRNRTLAAAANEVGVNERTLRRWQDEPIFKARLRDARRQLVQAAMIELQSAATDAVEALRRNLHCGTGYVEIGAAKAILEHATAAVELEDVLVRVEQLEAFWEDDSWCDEIRG